MSTRIVLDGPARGKRFVFGPATPDEVRVQTFPIGPRGEPAQLLEWDGVGYPDRGGLAFAIYRGPTDPWTDPAWGALDTDLWVKT